MKITLIGGGSRLWGPRLVNDLALTPELRGAEIVLQDVDAEALQFVHGAMRVVCERHGSGIRLSATLDRREALDGADFVVFCVGVGGLEAMRPDLEIPAKYGVVQPVGVSVGPGGLSRLLRHVPILLDVCRDMESLCPNAWLLNLTNPMTQLTRLVTRETPFASRTVGLCHEVTHFTEWVAETFNVPLDDVHVRAAGINHLPWITDIRIKDKPGFPLLDRWLDEHGEFYYAKDNLMGSAKSAFQDRKAVKFLLYRAFGSLPAAGDRHVAEFYPHFIREETHWGLDYGIELTTVDIRYELDRRRRNLARQWADEGAPTEGSGEQLAPLIAALVGGPTGRFIVNIPNQGQVPNLPRDAVIECFATVDESGVHPEFHGPLLPHPQQICSWHLAQMEIALDAAIKGDRHLVYQAAHMDPMVTFWDSVPKMMDEMLEANACYLPQFYR